TPLLAARHLRLRAAVPQRRERGRGHAPRARGALAGSAGRGVLRLRGLATPREGRARQGRHPAAAGGDQARSELGLPVDAARPVADPRGSVGRGAHGRAARRAAGARGRRPAPDAGRAPARAKELPRGGGGAREGDRAEPGERGRVPHARALPGRAEGLRSRARRPPAARRAAAAAGAGAVPPRPARHRDRELGRGDRAAHQGRGARSRPRRRVDGARLRVRDAPPHRGGRHDLPQGGEGEARAELERILRADPRSIDARVQLGFLYGRAKRFDESIAVLREAVNLEPRRPELFLYLGTAYFRAKEYDRALETLREGLLLDDKHRDLHFQVGVVLEKQAKFSDALGAFRRVIAIDPKHAAAYNYVGYIYAQRGQTLDEP